MIIDSWQLKLLTIDLWVNSDSSDDSSYNNALFTAGFMFRERIMIQLTINKWGEKETSCIKYFVDNVRIETYMNIC